MSIRCKDSNKAVIIEALRRARYKFPGRQKIIVSKKWGFTSLDRADYEQLKRDKMVINDGCYVQVSFLYFENTKSEADQYSSSGPRVLLPRTCGWPLVLKQRNQSRRSRSRWGEICCSRSVCIG